MPAALSGASPRRRFSHLEMADQITGSFSGWLRHFPSVGRKSFTAPQVKHVTG